MASSDESFSLNLSMAMDKIGINEEMIIRRRRAQTLKETIEMLRDDLRNVSFKRYVFGSLIEGTTSISMNSDMDNLMCLKKYEVIQSLNEWRFVNHTMLLFVQDDTTPPGYCYLQLLDATAAKPEVKLRKGEENLFIIDSKRRVLLKNDIVNLYITKNENDYRHGPCWSTKGKTGFCDQDTAIALACEWPSCSLSWFDEQSNSGWPTDEMKAYCRETPCFIVPVGRKGSPSYNIQWRISTSLSEKCLMFNLNITQIRSYILMKMILKTFFKPHVDKDLTSYMCKTILFHCVQKHNPCLWQEKYLFHCLRICLTDLYRSVLEESCPHFFIRSNNLMEGIFSQESKVYITHRLIDCIEHLQETILHIESDDLNSTLTVILMKDRALSFSVEECREIKRKIENNKIKFHREISGLISESMGEFLSETQKVLTFRIENSTSDKLKVLHKLFETIMKPLEQTEELDLETCKVAAPICLAITHVDTLNENRPLHGNLKEVHRFLFHSLKTVANLYRQDISKLERFACLTLTRLVCSSLIFIQVCLDLDNCSKHSLDIYPEIFQSFDPKLDFDVASYKLKKSSVFYCTGQIQEANTILEDVVNRYDLTKVESFCGCHEYDTPARRMKFWEISYLQNEQCLKEVEAFCVKFLPCEIRIVPKELQYEMFRSTKQDIETRDIVDFWCDYACVDSLIFLYFLQYKVSRCQKKLKDQELALTRLALATVTEANLGHRETAWNLLGQCLEYEHKSKGALHCYALSLRIRQQNNAARILICRLLSRKINKRKPATPAKTK